jgi:hypothetical protein
VQFTVKRLASHLLQQQHGAAFWALFHGGPHALATVTFDERALRAISNHLESDADGLVHDLTRYVQGSYRAKSKGSGGNRLGDFTEALTYLIYRKAKKSPIRVLSTRAGREERQKRRRFPQPDFIIKDGNKLRALEVKSTEALQYHKLHSCKWKKLAPCRAVEELRKEALPQLGFTRAGIKEKTDYKLMLKNGELCPFPADEGEAAVVLAVDGRVRPLRHETRFKTPGTCAKAGRNCWACLDINGTSAHLILATLRNDPGRLRLLGTGKSGSRWHTAYSRWGQAVWARDIDAAEATTRILAESTRDWLVDIQKQPVEGGPRVHNRSRNAIERAFSDLSARWGSYVDDCLLDRGLDDASVQVDEPLGRAPRPDQERDALRRETKVVRLNRAVDLPPLEAQRGTFSVRRAAEYEGSFGISTDLDGWDMRYCSALWWHMAASPDDAAGQELPLEAARSVASECLRAALWARDRQAIARGLPVVPLRPVTPSLDGDPVLVGWDAHPILDGGVWGNVSAFPTWFKWLAYGDPRASLLVLPDGRAHLRVRKH